MTANGKSLSAAKCEGSDRDGTSMLSERGTDLNVAVIGASGGIGAALLKLLCEQDEVAAATALSRTRPPDLPVGVRYQPVDLEDERSIMEAAVSLELVGPLDIVIVATGLLHDGGGFQPEKDWRQLDADRLARAFAVNAIGPALVAKHVLPLMTKQRPGVFAALSARVGSISDNRIGGWYGYRASKAALNMLLKSLAIEVVRKRQPTICIGLHPGTVDTSLSKPFQGSARPGQVVEAEVSARNLLTVIASLKADDSGHVFAWDGERIPA